MNVDLSFDEGGWVIEARTDLTGIGGIGRGAGVGVPGAS